MLRYLGGGVPLDRNGQDVIVLGGLELLCRLRLEVRPGLPSPERSQMTLEVDEMLLHGS